MVTHVVEWTGVLYFDYICKVQFMYDSCFERGGGLGFGRGGLRF